MTTYRTQVRIVADILTAAKDNRNGGEGVGITMLLRKSNMPYNRLSKLVQDLVSSGLLLTIEEGKANKYAISHEGLEFLNEYSRFEDFAVAFGLRL